MLRWSVEAGGAPGWKRVINCVDGANCRELKMTVADGVDLEGEALACWGLLNDPLVPLPRRSRVVIRGRRAEVYPY